MKKLLAVLITLLILLNHGIIFAQGISISLVGIENGETLTHPVNDNTSTGQITNSRKINFVVDVNGVYKKTPVSFLAKKEDIIVGLDQIIVNKSGRYTHSLVLSTDALWGDKIDIAVLPDKEIEHSIHFSVVLQHGTGAVYKPALSNVSLSTDKPHLGQEVSVDYHIHCDINEDYADHSVFQWYNATTGTPILGANKRIFIVPPECYDSQLRCEITPRIITKSGAEYFGDPFSIQSAEKVIDIMSVYDVKMDSSYKVGDTITVSYKYRNIENSDDDSIITWYRGGTQISDAFGAKYIITQSDVGKYIKARITVRSKDGKFGTTPLSPHNTYVEITSPVVIQDDNRTGRSSRGGGGGRASVGYITDNSEVKVPIIPNEPVEFVANHSAKLGAGKFMDVDVTTYSWAIHYLDTLVQDGIIVGTGDNTFSPDDYLTQAQYLALLMRIFDNIHIDNENITNWEEFIVEQANQHQLGMFIQDPNAPITRELMARATYAAILNNNVQLVSSSTKVEFNDIDMLDSATKNAINFLSECGIISGTGGGNFSPYSYTTRIQSVKVIGKIYLQTDKKIAAQEKAINEDKTRYEAEDAIIEGGCIISNEHAGYSGTGFIAEHKWIGSRVSFVINVPKSGDYHLTVRYAAGIHGVVDEFGRKAFSLYVNDEKVKQLIMPLTGEWNIWSEIEERIVLNSGQNIISFRIDDGDTGTINIDCIDVKAVQ